MMMTGIKGVASRAAHFLGVDSISRKLRSGPLVLFYHGVEESITDGRVQTLQLPLGQFEKQIAYLRKHFEIISCDELYDCISTRRKMDPSQVVLTFDDGYKNNLRIVAPLLESLGIPFSVFVSTRHITEGRRFPTYYLRASILYSKLNQAVILNETYGIRTRKEQHSTIAAVSRLLKTSPQERVDRIVRNLIRLLPQDQWDEINSRFDSDAPMNWNELGKLHDRGVTIGSHCHDHSILHRNQSINLINKQLQLSKALITEHLGKCKYIAYPNGSKNDISSDAVACVKASQYLAGFTTIEGEIENGMNRYLIPRIGAMANDVYHFAFRINTCIRHNRNYREWAKKLA